MIIMAQKKLSILVKKKTLNISLQLMWKQNVHDFLAYRQLGMFTYSRIENGPIQKIFVAKNVVSY